MIKWPPEPITIADHLAASTRLSRNDGPLPPNVQHADGSVTLHVRWGQVDGMDYTRRSGWPVVTEGLDRFGWPKGDPRSPASLHPQASR